MNSSNEERILKTTSQNLRDLFLLVGQNCQMEHNFHYHHIKRKKDKRYRLQMIGLFEEFSKTFIHDFYPYKLEDFKVARVVNLKLAFTDKFFYNLVVLIKLCKIRYLD